MPKVRDAMRLVEADGWRLVRIRGSHRHFHHPTKPGTVTIPGKASKQVPAWLWHSILIQAGLREQDGQR